MEAIREEVYKCSKCGLCKSVCPLYLATKNEMYSPRGRYIILNNFFNNNKKPSKKFFNDLDICLNCNLCKDFCPSNIDSAKIFTSLKKTSKLLYIKLFIIFNFFKLFNFYKKYNPKKKDGNNKVLYFEGCYNKYINCSDRNNSVKLLEKMGFKVEKIISKCCGYKFLTNNDPKKFYKNAENIINECKGNTKYIVCSCDSCFDTLSKLNDNEFRSKLIRFDELLKRNKKDFNFKSKNFYFKPLIRKDKCFIQNYIETANQKGDCSLMENFFAIRHPLLTRKILLKKNNRHSEKIITS